MAAGPFANGGEVILVDQFGEGLAPIVTDGAGLLDHEQPVDVAGRRGHAEGLRQVLRDEAEPDGRHGHGL